MLRAERGGIPIALGLGLMVVSAEVRSADPVFTDQTAASGLVATHLPSPWLELSEINVAPMLGGGAVGDFDADGDQDLFFLTGGAAPDKLFVNNGDGTFSERAAEWGIDRAHMGVGTAVGDFDGDGWLDLFVTSLGPAVAPPVAGGHLLYRNNGDPGAPGFTEVAETAGVSTTSPVTPDGFGACFGDYDLDGDLDLVTTGWVADSGSNRLFANNGDGTFNDVTTAAGLDGLLSCRSFSPRFADMDGDLYPELLVAADFQTSRYLVNNGDGTFSDVTAESGTGLDANGMGHTVGDFDGDGRFDWYVTSIYTPFSHLPSVPGTGNMLYMGVAEHLYLEQSVAAGVNDGGWGWGTAAMDADHDGLLDIVETNGWRQPNGPAGPEWADEQSYLFLNTSGGVFVDVATACGLIHTGEGRGLAALDYDDDGDLDLAIFAFDGPLTLFRNDVSGPDANWLRVALDTASRSDLAPDGLGARVTVTADGVTQMRLVEAGSNYLVQSEIPAHFGLGAATVVTTVEVTWPDGSTTLRRDVAANQTVVIQPGHPADLDGDGAVATGDLLVLLAAWGPCQDTCAADLDGNGTVGTGDLLILLGAWG